MYPFVFYLFVNRVVLTFDDAIITTMLFCSVNTVLLFAKHIQGTKKPPQNEEAFGKSEKILFIFKIELNESVKAEI